jgi:inosine/xanthosine triphosphate pyrophosphatase family protein
MKIFLATNNAGKVERYKNLLKHVDATIEVYTPSDLGVRAIDVVENGKTLRENAKLKANAYAGKVDMPILANDTGFYVEGEGFVDAPKRIALGDANEKTLSKEEISDRILQFWKGVAAKHGGKVDAAWVDSFAVVYPNGEVKVAESRREVVLTDTELGTPHIQMPVRALYYSKMTNKPAVQHNEEEEILEMQPITNALREVLNIT